MASPTSPLLLLDGLVVSHIADFLDPPSLCHKAEATCDPRDLIHFLQAINSRRDCFGAKLLPGPSWSRQTVHRIFQDSQQPESDEADPTADGVDGDKNGEPSKNTHQQTKNKIRLLESRTDAVNKGGWGGAFRPESIPHVAKWLGRNQDQTNSNEDSPQDEYANAMARFLSAVIFASIEFAGVRWDSKHVRMIYAVQAMELLAIMHTPRHDDLIDFTDLQGRAHSVTMFDTCMFMNDQHWFDDDCYHFHDFEMPNSFKSLRDTSIRWMEFLLDAQKNETDTTDLEENIAELDASYYDEETDDWISQELTIEEAFGEESAEAALKSLVKRYTTNWRRIIFTMEHWDSTEDHFVKLDPSYHTSREHFWMAVRKATPLGMFKISRSVMTWWHTILEEIHLGRVLEIKDVCLEGSKAHATVYVLVGNDHGVMMPAIVIEDDMENDDSDEDDDDDDDYMDDEDSDGMEDS